MTDKHHSHIEFHKKFQQVIQLALTDNKETIDGIDHLFKQEPDTWKPALIIAYRHLAEDRMRVNQCAETNQASAFVTEPSLDHDLTRSIFQTSPDQFVDLVFSNLKGEAKITLKADFERGRSQI